MKLTVRLQLSLMMLLQFFIWGSWYVTGPNYLATIGFQAADFGTMYSVGPIAGMIAPFFVGMIADRFFPAQIVLGVMHLLGAGLMFAATTLMQSATPVPSTINLLFFGHMLTYFPTLALTNTIAMKCMTNPEKEFPSIRVLGTIGWIVANLAVSWLGYDTKINMFYLTVVSGVALGILSFALPHTPPTKVEASGTTSDLIGLLFSFTGRIPRGAFWVGFVGTTIINIALTLIISTLVRLLAVTFSVTNSDLLLGVAVAAYAVVAIWMSLAVYAKRLHDINRSGWLSLLILVPVVNIWIFVLCGFKKGDEGGNKYGPSFNKAGAPMVGLLMNPAYLIFMLCSMLVCIPLAFYYQITSRLVEMTGLPIGQTMSYGQMSEIFFMLVMPLFFARLGVKWMLAVGMLAWVARYALFALGAPDEVRWMILVGILLHGICYDFFFVTGQIYTDQVVPEGARTQAQGVLVLFTLGFGMAIGANVAASIEARHTPETSKAFAMRVATKAGEIAQLEQQLKSARAGTEDVLTAQLKTLHEEKAALRKSELTAIEWKPLWAKPALFAAGVMVLFVLLFRQKARAQGNPASPS